MDDSQAQPTEQETPIKLLCNQLEICQLEDRFIELKTERLLYRDTYGFLQ